MVESEVARDDCVLIYIINHNGTGHHSGPGADGDVLPNECARTKKCAIAYAAAAR